MQASTYGDLSPRIRKKWVDAVDSGKLELTLTNKVPKGYVQDLKTGTIYRADTWLKRLVGGLAKLEDGKLQES